MLTEPLRFRLGHPMDHSNAAGSSLVASLPEMRTAHALACPLMGYVVQVRGNVPLGVSLSELCWGLRRKEKRISVSRVRNAVAQQKSGFAVQILLGGFRIRSLNFVGRSLVFTCSCWPLLGHPRAFQRYFAYQVPHSAVLVISAFGKELEKLKVRVNWRYLANLRAQKYRDSPDRFHVLRESRRGS